MKTLKDYEDKLKEMVTLRKGKLDAFLESQIKAAARCWKLHDKVGDELDNADLTITEYGSQGQVKTVMNPLLAQYDKMSRTLIAHFSALGLNFEATPSKVTETDAPGEKNDPLRDLMERVNKS